MNREKHFIVDLLFVLALFGVFTISAFILVIIGVDIYQNMVQDMSRNYEARASVSYVTEKFRQYDTLSTYSVDETISNISITTLAGEQALCLTQDIDGDSYCTYLYLYDEYLNELFVKSGTSLGGNILAAGQNILPLTDFNLEQINECLLSIELTATDGYSRQIYISTHCN